MTDNIATFAANSSGYSNSRPRYPQSLYDLLAGYCKSHYCAWDCGCGNGQVAIDLVPYFNAIEATDISPEQIAHGFPHGKISYSVRPAEKPGFPDNHFDLVCAAQCLHWFNPEKFFPEVQRVLKPGGIFACWGYGFSHVSPDVDFIIRHQIATKIDPFWAPENRIVQSGYRDYHFPFRKITVPDIEMAIDWDSEQLAAYLNSWSAVVLYNRHHATDIIASVKPALNHCIPDTVKVRMDFSCYVGSND